MRYVAAYLLATLAGKSDPSAADMKKILSSVGIDADNDKVQKVITELNGKNIEEIINEGSKKLSSVPSGGAVAAGSAGAKAAPAAAGGGGAAAAQETKKEEKKKEESEESDDDMGFGLFD